MNLTEIYKALPKGKPTNIKAHILSVLPRAEPHFGENPQKKRYLELCQFLDDTTPKKREFYQVFNITDSSIIEYIFRSLAKILDIDYDIVYRKWIYG